MSSHPPCLPSEICDGILDTFALKELVLLMEVSKRCRDLVRRHRTYCSMLDLPDKATPAQLLFFFARANRAALSQRRLHMDVQFWDGAQNLADRTLDVVSLNRTHIVRLRVHFRADMFPRVQEAIRTMPQIEHLDLTALHADNQGRLAKNIIWASSDADMVMRKLRHLRLAGIQLEARCSSIFAGVVSLVLSYPWDGQPVVFDCVEVMGALGALRDLSMSGHISLLHPRDTAARARIDRLIVHSRLIDLQWPTLRNYLTNVPTLEFNIFSQEGVDAIAEHLQGKLSECISIRSSDNCIVFSLSGECGKSIAFAYGGDGYETLSEDLATRDIYRLSDKAFVHRVARIEIDVDMWDTQPRRNHPYQTLETITMVWMENSSVDTCSTVSPSGDECYTPNQLAMPIGEPDQYYICPNLKTLRLESREKGNITAYIDIRDVEDFARRSFSQMDVANLTLELAGIRLSSSSHEVDPSTGLSSFKIIRPLARL